MPPSSAACWPPGPRRRQVGLRGPVFSGGSHTSRTGAVRNPWDPVPVRGRVIERQRGTGRGRAGRTWRLAATRAARSASRAPSAARSGTSPPTDWCRSPRVPIENTLDHLARSRRPSATPRCCSGCWRGRTGWTTGSARARRPAITWRTWRPAWPGCGSASSGKGSPSPASPSPRWTRRVRSRHPCSRRRRRGHEHQRAVAPRRACTSGTHRHRRSRGPDDRRQRLRDEHRGAR